MHRRRGGGGEGAPCAGLDLFQPSVDAPYRELAGNQPPEPLLEHLPLQLSQVVMIHTVAKAAEVNLPLQLLEVVMIDTVAKAAEVIL